MKLHLATLELKSYKNEALKYVKVTKKFCMASDGTILVEYPTKNIFSEDFINEMPDNGFLIHQEDWKEVIKASSHVWKSQGVIKCLMGSKRDVLIECESEANIAVYPVFDQIIPSESSLKELPDISIDAKKLFNLQEAMGVASLKMQFTQRNGAILVTPSLKDNLTKNIIGVIMPVFHH